MKPKVSEMEHICPIIKYGTLVQIFNGEKVLMIKKPEREGDPNSGFYTLPRGKLEEFEKGGNPYGRLECAIRELMDETGLIVSNSNLLWRGVILFDNCEELFLNGKNQIIILLIFLVLQNTGGD